MKKEEEKARQREKERFMVEKFTMDARKQEEDQKEHQRMQKISFRVGLDHQVAQKRQYL